MPVSAAGSKWNRREGLKFKGKELIPMTDRRTKKIRRLMKEAGGAEKLKRKTKEEFPKKTWGMMKMPHMPAFLCKLPVEQPDWHADTTEDNNGFDCYP
jgi:hypothetical protein